MSTRDPYSDPYYLQLLTAVVADPTDDFPRQIVADWLEEQGEAERAELIRVQLELPLMRMRGQPGVWSDDDPENVRYNQHIKREKTLLYTADMVPGRFYGVTAANWNRWYGWAPRELQRLHDNTLPGFNHPNNRTSWTYQRGFIEMVECQADRWDKNGEAILKQCPISTVALEDLDAADAYLEWGEVTVTMYPNHRDGTWLNFARWKTGGKQIRFKVKSFDHGLNRDSYNRWADQYTMVKSVGYKAGKTLAEQIEQRTIGIRGTAVAGTDWGHNLDAG